MDRSREHFENTCQCLNPDCLKYNPENSQFCQYCGQKLLLMQRYRGIRILGQGGFGRTFLAVDEFKPSLPSCVIKQFFPQAQGTSNLEKASELFAQEAENLEKLGKNPQIPELIAYLTQDSRQYLVQEYIAGETLAQELQKNGVFKEAEIWQLLKDVLSILQFVHQNNVIHRDIKPDNLIRRSKDNKIVLVGFGASKLTENTSMTVTGTVIGAAEYTAPEQSRGKPKYCSDLYSLGVTCLYLLTQVSPFDLYSVDEMDWVWRDFLSNNAVSDELGNILDKLVESAVKRRYQTVDEVLNDINNISGLRSPQPLITPKPATPKGIQLRRFSFETVTITVESALLGLGNSIREQIEMGEAEYFRVNLGNNVTLDLIKIPAGQFLMGAPKNEEGSRDDERPQHLVTLSSFFMGKYPITQAQYQAVIGNNPSRFKGENRPVERVSWHDAVEFCEKLSQKTGLHFSLPSASQWEYACRARTTTPFYFGETISTNLANYNDDYVYANGKTTNVGIFPANKFGLYDTHGNVWEWCEDDYVSNYESTPRDGMAYRGNSIDYAVLRGGSWFVNLADCRSANRFNSRRNSRESFIGFRVVCCV
ncbi:MAG: SUMF1/EgtB/PvdO family nonheme iron enzyme [Microcystaceae cyanobacterium]